MDIGEVRYKAGDVGLDDLLKLKLQMLQFQTDVSAHSSPGCKDFRISANYSDMNR